MTRWLKTSIVSLVNAISAMKGRNKRKVKMVYSSSLGDYYRFLISI